MFDVFIVQDHHHKRDRHAVVRSQCCAVCREYAVFEYEIDSLFLKIMLYACTFITYHIDMSLKHDRLFLLCAFASLFLNDDIIAVVLIYPKSSVFCKLYKEIADTFFISRSSRYGTDLLKKMK